MPTDDAPLLMFVDAPRKFKTSWGVTGVVRDNAHGVAASHTYVAGASTFIVGERSARRRACLHVATCVRLRPCALGRMTRSRPDCDDSDQQLRPNVSQLRDGADVPVLHSSCTARCTVQRGA